MFITRHRHSRVSKPIGLAERVVHKVTRHFIRAVLKDVKDLNGYCFATSLPLSILLNNLRIRNSVVSGTVYGISHSWIDLHNNTIIDPTITQFIPRFNGNAYVGKKPRCYKKIEKRFSPSWKDYLAILQWELESKQHSEKAIEKLKMNDRAMKYLKTSKRYKESGISQSYFTDLDPLIAHYSYLLTPGEQMKIDLMESIE